MLKVDFSKSHIDILKEISITIAITAALHEHTIVTFYSTFIFQSDQHQREKEMERKLNGYLVSKSSCIVKNNFLV